MTTATNGQLLALGNFKRDERLAPPFVADEAALELRVANTNREAAQWLDVNAARVLLIDNANSSAGSMSRGTRHLATRTAPDRPQSTYRTKVAFRGAGRDADDFGFTYNVSEGGLYVRTLAPPTEDTAWIELRPPHADRLVRLGGQVVWRRRFGPAGGATVPPGFGVKIPDATRASLESWTHGHAAFDQMLSG